EPDVALEGLDVRPLRPELVPGLSQLFRIAWNQRQPRAPPGEDSRQLEAEAPRATGEQHHLPPEVVAWTGQTAAQPQPRHRERPEGLPVQSSPSHAGESSHRHTPCLLCVARPLPCSYLAERAPEAVP